MPSSYQADHTHTAQAEDRGKFFRDEETQQLPVGAGISLLLHFSPQKTNPIALALRLLSIPFHSGIGG